MKIGATFCHTFSAVFDNEKVITYLWNNDMGESCVISLNDMAVELWCTQKNLFAIETDNYVWKRCNRENLSYFCWRWFVSFKHCVWHWGNYTSFIITVRTLHSWKGGLMWLNIIWIMPFIEILKIDELLMRAGTTEYPNTLSVFLEMSVTLSTICYFYVINVKALIVKLKGIWRQMDSFFRWRIEFSLCSKKFYIEVCKAKSII